MADETCEFTSLQIPKQWFRLLAAGNEQSTVWRKRNRADCHWVSHERFADTCACVNIPYTKQPVFTPGCNLLTIRRKCHAQYGCAKLGDD